MNISAIALLALLFSITFWRLNQKRDRSGINFRKIRNKRIEKIKSTNNLVDIAEIIDHLRSNHPILLADVSKDPNPPLVLKYAIYALSLSTIAYFVTIIPTISKYLPQYYTETMLIIYFMSLSLECWLQYNEHRFICAYKAYNCEDEP